MPYWLNLGTFSTMNVETLSGDTPGAKSIHSDNVGIFLHNRETT